MLVKRILQKARKNKYAIPAFNISDLELLEAVVSAAEKFKSPVIIATTESTIKYAGLEYLVSMVKTASKLSKVPIILHLDHGHDLKLIKKCIKSGYESIMFDGSNLSFNKNISLTKKVVKLAKKKNINVEAELGALKEKKEYFTDPEQAKKFVYLTKIDSLAVSIGTVHGAYKGNAKLDFKRLEKISKKLKIPLVLHGASGVDRNIIKIANKYGAKLKYAKGIKDRDIKKAIKLGISKINIDTDLRLAFTSSLRSSLKKYPKDYDPRKFLELSRKEIEKIAIKKIKLCGSQNKA